MCGNYCLKLNNDSDNIFNKNVINTYSNCSSNSSSHIPHTLYIVNNSSGLSCNCPSNNNNFTPTCHIFPRNFNFSHSEKPVPGSDSLAPASSHHVPLTPGSINQSSDPKHSSYSICPEIFKNGWSAAVQTFSMARNDPKPVFSAAASAGEHPTSHVANADSGSSGIYI